MRKVFLKYGFIFEPVETWSTQSDFELDTPMVQVLISFN